MRKAYRSPIRRLVAPMALVLVMLLTAGCLSKPWNNPYPARDSDKNILYSSFEERPKHLDPVRSYSSNEYAFIAQIYEPPFQYDFLRRPYRLAPLSATRLPKVTYYDAKGKPVDAEAASGDITMAVYEIEIRPGIHYQPHPAFAKDENGAFLYHDLSTEEIEAANRLADFPRTGTRELVAADFVYQIKRLAFPHLHSPIRGLMADYIIGFDAYGKRLQKVFDTHKGKNGTGWLDLRQYPLEGVEAIGRYRFRIRLKQKYPQFAYWLAMPFFAPMPWEADRFYAQPGMAEHNITLDWYPVGTGPFMLTENNPNLRMVLSRNPNFHGESYPEQGDPGDAEAGLLRDAGKPMPFIDKAIYSLEKESIPYWNKFLQGYYDSSGISSDSFDQAVQFSAQGEAQLTDAMRKKGIKLLTAVSTSISYMGFNMRDPVIGGLSESARLLRQAISIAVDYEEYISIFANGRGVPAQGPIPPGIFGYRPPPRGVNHYVYEVVNGKPHRKPIEEARRLLAKAGYPGGRKADTGEPLILYFDVTASGPDDKARLNWVRKQFARLGIQLVLRTTDYNRFQEKMRKGTAQIFWWGWNADYPDPENFFFLLYGPNGKVAHGGENAANYANPEFDRLFERMKNMRNSPERQKVIDEMMEIVRRDAPWVWGMFPKAFSLHHAWYHNVKPNLMANNTLKYRRVDPQLRKQKRLAWNPPVLWPIGLLLALLMVSAIPAVVTWRRRERSAAR